MRSILIGSAAAVLAISSASPAFAQYGGSPDTQVEGAAPGDEQPDALAGDEDADPDEAYSRPEDQGAFEDAGPPPEEAYRGDADQDVDEDVDQDIDQDVDQDVDEDVDQDTGEPGPVWQGEDGRSSCRRSDGTTGLIVGGGAGALVGRGIDSHGRRGTGTIIGAIAGALVGTAIERSANEQRCR